MSAINSNAAVHLAPLVKSNLASQAARGYVLVSEDTGITRAFFSSNRALCAAIHAVEFECSAMWRDQLLLPWAGD